jgi:hypothetical protein
MGVVDELIASGATPTPSFLKVDVEGHELAVLRGAATLIASRHPNWLLEVCSDTADDVFTFLQERGYAAWHWEARAFRSVSRFEVGAEPDYLFVHPASARQLEVGTGTGASLAASRRSVSR